jgi:hypothetical protein
LAETQFVGQDVTFYKCDVERVSLPDDRFHEFCELPTVKLFPHDLDSIPWHYYGTLTDLKDAQEWVKTSIKVSEVREKRKQNVLKPSRMLRARC